MECIGNHCENGDIKYTSLFNNSEISDSIIKALQATKATTTTAKGSLNIPDLFWILHYDFPKVLFDANQSEEIDYLLKKRSIIFLNINSLRRQGIYIRRHVSWESAAQDYVCALYSNPLLSGLRHYRHVVTRFGLTGAIYSYRLGKSRWLHRLLIDPAAKNTGLYRDVSTEGDVVGYQTIFATCVLNEIVGCISDVSEADEVEITEKVCDGIRKAMVSYQQIFEVGLGDDLNQCIPNFNSSCQEAFKKFSDKNNNDWKKIGQARIPVANPAWSILVQSAEYRLFKIAETIVVTGIDAAINNFKNHSEPVWAPILKFGGEENPLIVIDRREIESYRVIHGLISRALIEDSEKILSIAVFGPPGSGKSFTVKKLSGSAHSGEHSPGFKTINMTNVLNKEALDNEIFKLCWSQYVDNKIPVIFFDEFDCKFGDEELGWLKAFLSPMEDFDIEDLISYIKEIKMQEIQKTKSDVEKIEEKIAELNAEIKKCRSVGRMPIFVFAGGTSHNYLDFCHEDNSWSDEQKAYFVKVKGPDFVSRLRGHIDILGIDRVDDYDDAHVIRRAILLRSLLLKRLKKEDNEKYDLTPFLDLSIIKAMLKVSSFKHGARSMSAIINMSFTIGGPEGKLVGSTLPTLPQLNMHINGKEFLEMVISESQLK